MGIIVTEDLLDKIDNYLKGTLSVEDTIAFEKQMQGDSALKDLVKIQQGLFDLHDFKSTHAIEDEKSLPAIQYYKEQLKNDENQRLFHIIKEVGQKNSTPLIQSKSNYLQYYVAASVAILLSTFFYFYSNSDLENYYEDNVNWEELPSYTIKGEDTMNAFTKGEDFFRNKKFIKAIACFEKIPSSNELYPYSLLYIGASYEQLNQNEKAVAIFQKVTEIPNFDEKSKGYWYQLLIYLKCNNKEKAIEKRNLILRDSNNFNYEKAKALEL